MKFKTHKIIVSIALTLVLCTGAALLAQALFQAFTGDVDGTVTVTPPAAGNAIYVSVATEAELIAATKDATYNANNPYSQATTRKIVQLTEDITLNSDLLITLDCHIDLGTHTLDTNGYTVTVFHTYTGAFVIANGKLISSKTVTDDQGGVTPVNGSLVINTPNAAVLVDTSVTTTNMNAVQESISEEQVRLAALSMVCAYLSNTLDHGIYGWLGAQDAQCTLPNYTGIGCDAHANGCCFTVGEPDLPYWFFGYRYRDLSITYQVNSDNVWVNGENTLTATVTFGTSETESENVSTQSFIVHKLAEDDTTAQASAAAAIVLKELSPFLDETGKYNFSTPILLPSKVSLGDVDVTMSYSTTGGTLNGTKYSPVENGGNLTVNGVQVDTTGNITSVEETDYTRANRVIKELFGGGIIIQKTASGYTSQSLAYDLANFPPEYDIQSIEFDLINNLEYHDYEIVDNVLRVTTDGAPESHFVNVMLQAVVHMHEDDENEDNDVAISISVPIRCQVDQQISNQVDQFLPYYYYFNRLFTETTSGNYTYTSFSMPDQYVDGKAKIAFYVVDPDTANDQGGYTFILATDPAVTQKYPFLTVTHENGEWNFTIDPEKIGLNDQQVIFGYGYTFNSETPIENYEKFSYANGADGKYSVLTVPGVVNKGNVDTEGFGDIPNPALYEFIYKIYHSEDEEYDADTDYIYASRLTHEVNMKADATNDGWADTDNIVLNFEGKQATFVTPVADEDYDPFEGLELLDNALSINLANSGITVSELQYVAGMENLQYLNLANNGLVDGTNFNANNEFISTLTTLENLKELHLENVENDDGTITNPNVIYDFTALSDFQSLEKAYVYGNAPTITLIGWEPIDNLLTDVVRLLYGSEGAINTAIFSTIYVNTEVYNTTDENGVPVLFAPSEDAASEFSALMNLQYQDKLLQGLDIGLIYQGLSDSPDAYGIPVKKETIYTLYADGSGLSDAPEEHRNYITFSYTGNDPNTATEIVLIYHNYVSVDGYQDGWQTKTVAFDYTVEFKFPITRVDENGTPIN